MREAVHFTFDGISSEDMGVHIVSVDGGLYQESFLPNRTIVEQPVANNYKPYFKRVDNEPLAFTLTIFIEEWQQRNNLRQIARWFFQPYYKPLSFDINYEKIFYVIAEGDSTLFHNGAKNGYITLNFRCDSPYSYSPLRETPTLSSSSNFYSIFNEGDLVTNPKIRIKKTVSNGPISIKNETSGQVFSFSNLQVNEEVFVDCFREVIISSLEVLNVYRYGVHNGEWLELLVDTNLLKFTGDFDISFEYEFIYLID